MVAKVKDEKLGTSSSSSQTQELKKGPWKPEEDMLLIEYVKKHGERDWNMVRKHSGLARCGKSCRLRWNNHLRPNLRKGPFSPEEEKLICELHSKIGNKWARIATMLPGRTDNEIKNFWNTRIKRLARKGAPLYPPDIVSPRQDLTSPYLHQINGQNNPSPPSTSSSTLQSNFQAQISPTTPSSHPLLFPPPTSSPSHYDVILQNSMALYDAALENSRQQQQQQQMFAPSFNRFRQHRSVPNLTISVPPIRHVVLHPFSPLGISTSTSPMGQSVSMANSPTTSYMQVTPMQSPHSYTSSPTGMVVSPTALQLGIPLPTQPSFRLPVSASPPVMNLRPTCLPRTTSFSFDHMLFDLNPVATQEQRLQNTQTQVMNHIDNCNNELAFSIEDLGISMEPEIDIDTTNPSNQVINDDTGVCQLDEFLNVEDMKFEEAEFSAEQAKAFINELDTDWNEQDHELSNLLSSNELVWDNDNVNVNVDESCNGDQHAQAPSQLNHYADASHMGLELTSSVPVAASSGWDILPGVY